MRFWKFLRFTAPDDLPALARAVEATLFDGIVLGDHVVFPEKIESEYIYSKTGKVLRDPETPWPDVWIAAAAMAAITKRIHFPATSSSCRCAIRSRWRAPPRPCRETVSRARHRLQDARQAL